MEDLKTIGIALSLLGTLILAIRVTRLIEQLCLAVKSHDLNFEIEAARARGENIPNIRMYGNASHIDNEQKLGTKLLVVGFSLQILGGICNALALIY